MDLSQSADNLTDKDFYKQCETQYQAEVARKAAQHSVDYVLWQLYRVIDLRAVKSEDERIKAYKQKVRTKTEMTLELAQVTER